MYMLDWKEGISGTLYRVVRDTDALNLPEPRYVCFRDLHPAFQQAFGQVRLLGFQGIDHTSESSFRITQEQFEMYWQLVQEETAN